VTNAMDSYHLIRLIATVTCVSGGGDRNDHLAALCCIAVAISVIKYMEGKADMVFSVGKQSTE